MDMKKILEMFSDFTNAELKELKTEITKLEFARDRNFLKNISEGNLDGVKESLRLGINWESSNLWKDLYRLPIDNTNLETLDYVIKGDIPNVKLGSYLMNDFSGDIREITGLSLSKKYDKETIDSSHVFKELMKSRVEKKLIYSSEKFDEKLFLKAKDYLGEEKFKEILPKAISSFAKYDISKDFQYMHQYIIENDLIIDLAIGISAPASYDFFFNKKEYADYLNNCSEDVKNEVMSSAIENAQGKKIKALHEFGLSLSVPEKQPYSNLFMKTDEKSHEAQDYVISNIENVCIGNHVILKTMLHKSFDQKDDAVKINFIQKVLETYSDEDMKSMPVILNKREPTPRVLFTQKYYEYRKLNLEMHEELDNGSNQEVKKLKI